MEAVLIVALVAVNLFWIIYNDRRDTREQDERRALLNRLANPKIVEPDNKMKELIVEEAREKMEGEPDAKVRYEYAAVGRVDPNLIRPDNGD